MRKTLGAKMSMASKKKAPESGAFLANRGVRQKAIEYCAPTIQTLES